MEFFFEFTPEKRFCGALLSEITPATVPTIFGEPDEIEQSDKPAYGEDIAVYHFFKLQLTLFFNVHKLLNIAIANPEFKIFDTEIFKLRETELITLFQNNGFPKHEMDSEWGEKQLVFEDANMTVFFDNQLVSEIFIDM